MQKNPHYILQYVVVNILLRWYKQVVDKLQWNKVRKLISVLFALRWLIFAGPVTKL